MNVPHLKPSPFSGNRSSQVLHSSSTPLANPHVKIENDPAVAGVSQIPGSHHVSSNNVDETSNTLLPSHLSPSIRIMQPEITQPDPPWVSKNLPYPLLASSCTTASSEALPTTPSHAITSEDSDQHTELSQSVASNHGEFLEPSILHTLEEDLQPKDTVDKLPTADLSDAGQQNVGIYESDGTDQALHDEHKPDPDTSIDEPLPQSSQSEESVILPNTAGTTRTYSREVRSKTTGLTPFSWENLRHDLRFAIADAKASIASGLGQHGAEMIDGGKQMSAPEAYLVPEPGKGARFRAIMGELFGMSSVERAIGTRSRATNTPTLPRSKESSAGPSDALPCQMADLATARANRAVSGVARDEPNSNMRGQTKRRREQNGTSSERDSEAPRGPKRQRSGNAVGEDVAEEWTGELQKLIKGKKMLGRREMIELSDVLTKVEAGKDHIDHEVLQKTRLRRSIEQLADMEEENFPSGKDVHRMRKRARSLVQFWLPGKMQCSSE